MLTQIYIEALLVDEELADQVWEAWDSREIDDSVATWAWWVVMSGEETRQNGISSGFNST